MCDIKIDNLDEFYNFLSCIAFTSKLGKTFMFTNGNDWYVDTLIQNLLTSYKKWNTDTSRQIGVICTDTQGYEKAQNLGMTCFLLKSSDLAVDQLNDSSKQHSYSRLCFVKTLIAYYALQKDYNIIYLDPDMSFNLEQKVEFIDELISGSLAIDFKLENHSDPRSAIIEELPQSIPYEVVFCGGYATGWGKTRCYLHLNSNVMVIKPTPYTKDLFTLTQKELEYYSNHEWYLTDEDFLSRYGREPHKMQFLTKHYYPGGKDCLQNRSSARMFHANCVSGLQNKIALLKECGGWYLN